MAEGVLTPQCGPHCGTKDGKGAHCQQCHFGVSHGNAKAGESVEVEEGFWRPEWQVQ